MSLVCHFRHRYAKGTAMSLNFHKSFLILSTFLCLGAYVSLALAADNADLGRLHPISRDPIPISSPDVRDSSNSGKPTGHHAGGKPGDAPHVFVLTGRCVG